jgi:hypothetical protein
MLLLLALPLLPENNKRLLFEILGEVSLLSP